MSRKAYIVTYDLDSSDPRTVEMEAQVRGALSGATKVTETSIVGIAANTSSSGLLRLLKRRMRVAKKPILDGTRNHKTDRVFIVHIGPKDAAWSTVVDPAEERPLRKWMPNRADNP